METGWHLGKIVVRIAPKREISCRFPRIADLVTKPHETLLAGPSRLSGQLIGVRPSRCIATAFA